MKRNLVTGGSGLVGQHLHNILPDAIYVSSSAYDLTKMSEKEGLQDFMRILEQMKEFEVVEFTIGDIVRSGFVRSYLIEKTKLGLEE